MPASNPVLVDSVTPATVLAVNRGQQLLDSLLEEESVEVSTVEDLGVVERVLANESGVECVLAGPELSSDDVIDLLDICRAADEQLPFVLVRNGPTDVGERLNEDSFADHLDVSDLEDRGLLAARIRTLVSYLRTTEELRMKNRGLDQAPVGITITDPSRPDNPLTYVNEGFERLTGYDVESILGKNCRFLQGEETDPETIAKIREAIDEERSVEVEIRNYRKDGTPFWNHLEIAPVYEDGEVVNFAGYQKDVTERKKAEQALRRQNERLETVANVLSHDIRNPLQIALGRLDMLAESSDAPAQELEAVRSSLLRIESIVEDALMLASVDHVENPKIVDLATRSTEAWAQVPVGDAALDVGESASFRADPGLLDNVFENLFRNAIDHGNATTVRVGLLDVAGGSPGFYVTDDGTGVPSDVRNSVFDLGYTTSVDGSGMGLAIVKRIVEAHGWRITVTDEETGGARFEVRGVEFV